jgi:hypothetical protein
MRFVMRIGVLSADRAGLARASIAAKCAATEIKIGQTMPTAARFRRSALGKGEVGYFRMLNERGGINGRRSI